MNPPPLEDDLDAWLRTGLQAGTEPDDAGFSLRVMAAVKPRISRAQRRRAAALRWARWLTSTAAACSAALLLGSAGAADSPHALAGWFLLALLLYWSLPGRWSRG